MSEARITSTEAYRLIESEGLLSRRRLEAYRALAGIGRGATGSEIASVIPGAIVNNVRTRLTELRDRGVVREAGEVQCPITHQKVISWEIVEGALPSEPTRVKTPVVKREPAVELKEPLLAPTKPDEETIRLARLHLVRLRSFMLKKHGREFPEPLIRFLQWSFKAAE